MQANSSGAELLRTISKFRKGENIISSHVVVIRRSRALMAKKIEMNKN